jgi:hypothetical protein
MPIACNQNAYVAPETGAKMNTGTESSWSKYGCTLGAMPCAIHASITLTASALRAAFSTPMAAIAISSRLDCYRSLI